MNRNASGRDWRADVPFSRADSNQVALRPSRRRENAADAKINRTATDCRLVDCHRRHLDDAPVSFGLSIGARVAERRRSSRPDKRILVWATSRRPNAAVRPPVAVAAIAIG